MGLLSNLIAYKIGKRVGRGESPEEHFSADPYCVHYETCANEGGCLSQSCEYEEAENY